MKEHVYNIGYHTYEESEYEQLCHKQKYSTKEFEQIVIKAAINVLKEYKKEQHISFQNIFHELVEELIKNFNFKKLEFDAQFSVFGWASVVDKKDWEHDRDEQLNELTRAILKNKR